MENLTGAIPFTYSISMPCVPVVPCESQFTPMNYKSVNILVS